MNTIRTRKPTGTVPWPLILIEGPEKSGKSYAAAQFTADERIGQTYWLDLGEGAADEYASIPGADYLVIEHDGTWSDITGQVAAVRDEAARAQAAGEPPVMLVIDSMTAEWDLLKDWVTDRARKSNYAKKMLRRDPNAEIKPAANLWNDANLRHNTLMRMLMTFPGIVVMTARGKEIMEMGQDGKPIPGARTWKVEGQKNLAFDASAWVRLSRDEPPQVIGMRSIHAGVRPGVDKPKPVPDLNLGWLTFDVLGCKPAATHTRDLQHLDGQVDEAPEPAEGTPASQPRDAARNRPAAARAATTGGGGSSETGQQEPPMDDGQQADLAQQIEARIRDAGDRDTLTALWREAGRTPTYTEPLREQCKARAAELQAAA